MKDASLPQGVRAERCWCGHLAKVKEVEDFSDWLGIKFFMCANYDNDRPRQASSSLTRPPVCSNSMMNRHILCHCCSFSNVLSFLAVSSSPLQVVPLD